MAKSSTKTTVEVKTERNWTLKLIDKVLGLNPHVTELKFETTCLKSNSVVKGSLETMATLLEDGVITGFACGNPHTIEKEEWVTGDDGKRHKTGKKLTKTAYTIKLFGLDISKESSRNVWKNGEKTDEVTIFRWFNYIYQQVQQAKQLVETEDELELDLV